MDLNSLQLFVAAAQAGTLSEAARRSGVPLPTLSRRVRRLEEELGVRLLERGTQGLRLTNEGTRLLADVGPALASLTQAEDRLHDETKIAGTLRVSVPPSFEPLWPLLSRCAREYSAARFDVFVTDRRVDLVADGIDVAIHVAREGADQPVGRLLARYRHRVIASPAFLERHPVRVPADLAMVPSGCFRTRTGTPSVWMLGDEQVRLTARLATNDYLHLRHVALAGEVVTELPPFLAEGPIREGRLVSVLDAYPMRSREVWAVVPDTRLTSPLVRRFLESCAEALRIDVQVPSLSAGSRVLATRRGRNRPR